MTGRELAQKIKDILDTIDGISNVYIYIPPIKTEEEALKQLLDSTARVNAWFVTRSGLHTQRYGEAAGRISTRQRIKRHTFQIKGYWSLSEDAQALHSEEAFQDLCDTIEGVLAANISLGVTSHTVIAHSMSSTIGYEIFSQALSHIMQMSLTIDEYLQTSYV